MEVSIKKHRSWHLNLRVVLMFKYANFICNLAGWILSFGRWVDNRAADLIKHAKSCNKWLDSVI